MNTILRRVGYTLGEFTMVLSLAYSIGDGWVQKFRLVSFLLAARISHRTLRWSMFRIRVNGRPTDIWVRNMFADSQVLYEMFVSKDYERGLPSEAPSVIFDVGANIGYATVYLKTRYPKARVWCFEPDSDNLELLRKNVMQFPDVTCVQTALGASEGSITLYRSPLFHTRHSILAREGNTERITVPMTTLSNAMRDAGVGTVDLLKIDIEGAEDAVLSPFRQFDHIGRIVGELHPYLLPKERYDALCDMLRAHYRLDIRVEDGREFFTAARER